MFLFVIMEIMVIARQQETLLAPCFLAHRNVIAVIYAAFPRQKDIASERLLKVQAENVGNVMVYEQAWSSRDNLNAVSI